MMQLPVPNRALTPATSTVSGNKYTIANVGSTNWTLIGASSNTVGVTFTATGVGSGTGNAFLAARRHVKIR